MGRANNTSRSLCIISKQQGWDPYMIADVGQGPGHGDDGPYDLRDVGLRVKESPYELSSTQDPFIGNANDLQRPGFVVSPPPSDDRGQAPDHGPQGNPYPAMPGAAATIPDKIARRGRR